MSHGGRLYRRKVTGRNGWTALYCKEVDADEQTLRFWQEILDDTGDLMEVHGKFPIDQGHKRIQTFWVMVTRHDVAHNLEAYLDGSSILAHLVDWAENTLAEAEFPSDDEETLAEIVSRLGLADVRAFGLTWEDCQAIFRTLGMKATVHVVAA